MDRDDTTISFNGAKPFLLDNSPGLFYIRFLLQHPDVPVHVAEICQAWSRYQAPQRSQADFGIDGITDNEHIGLEQTIDDGPVLGQQGKQQCWEEYQELHRKLEQAQNNRDDAKIIEYQQEIEELEEYIRSAYKPNGKNQTLGRKPKRQLDRVSKAIERSIEKIGSKDPRLQRHFLNAIKKGYYCLYTAESHILWNF